MMLLFWNRLYTDGASQSFPMLFALNLRHKISASSRGAAIRQVSKAGDTLSSRHVSSCDVKARDTISSRHVSSCDVKTGDTILTSRELM